MLYVPNIADSMSSGLAGAIYGVILLLVIFVMPSGAAGFARFAVGASARSRSPIGGLKPRIQQGGHDEAAYPSHDPRAGTGAVALAGRFCRRAPALAPRNTVPASPTSEIKIGNTGPYSGPASSYSTFGKSQAAYYKMINDQGGINGRKINFISYDDAYTPPKTVEMVRKLVEQDEVLLIASPLGTPTNSAIWHYMNQKKVPQLFVATGATKWDDPKGHPWTIGWQPNYQSEGRIYAAYILKEKPDGKIGVLYQNDDFGKDYLKGVKDGLGDKASSMIVVEATYETTDPTVDSQVVGMKAAGCDVFVNTAIPKFAAQAIRKAAEIEWKPLHILSSIGNSVGATLKPAGLENCQGHRFRFLPEGPDRPEMEGRCRASRPGSPFMDKYLPGRRQDRRRLRRRLFARRDVGAGAEAMRRRADPRKRDEAGGQPARFHGADAAAGDQDQHQPDRFRAGQAGADGDASTASAGSCSARC